LRCDQRRVAKQFLEVPYVHPMIEAMRRATVAQTMRMNILHAGALCGLYHDAEHLPRRESRIRVHVFICGRRERFVDELSELLDGFLVSQLRVRRFAAYLERLTEFLDELAIVQTLLMACSAWPRE